MLLVAIPLVVSMVFVSVAALGDRSSHSGDISDGEPSGTDPSANPAPAEVVAALSASSVEVYPAEPVTLPIRMIARRTRTISLHVSNPDGIGRLWLQVHSPAYRDQRADPERNAKGSVRVNGGPWIDMTNANANVERPEALHGGIGGSFDTIRFSVPISGVQKGDNQITFRFNGTNGLTSGYRVLQVNFLRGYDKVLPESAFVQEDPSDWSAPEGYASQSDVEAGRELWYNAELIESLELGVDQEPLEVSCSGCHAADGHDLKYFAFANETIQARSEFHGLSEEEGKQIAAYIRSIELRGQDGRTYEAPGRPWTPPYQPAPGLDEKPPYRWAAGGGLEWVLEEDAQMWDYLIGDASSLREAFALDQDMNVREQPIAMQLPDWNDWLPRKHPETLFGDHFLATRTIGAGQTWRDDVLGHFEAMKRTLRQEGALGLARGANEMARFGGAARKYYLDRGGGLDHIQDPTATTELARVSMKKWAAVKIFQEMQKHHLSDDADVVFGEDGEARSWLTADARVVFEIGPHLSADNSSYFDWQTFQTGIYSTTAWYQTQLILNTGNGQGGAINPLDWNYHPKFIQNLDTHVARSTQAFAKMLQVFSESDRPVSKFYVRQVHPGLYGPGGKYANAFDRAGFDRRRKAYNALLSALMDKLEAHSISEWEVWRRPDGSAGSVFRPPTYTPSRISGSIGKALHGKDFQWADGWYTMIPRFEEAGVDPRLLNRMVDWGKQMWPRGNWASVRPEESVDDGPSFEVTSLTLVNADTNEELRVLSDGDEIVLSALPTRNLNVYANTSGEVGSVVFALDDKAGYQTESLVPYALEKDKGALTPSVGEHTLTATPYAKARGKGDSGTAYTVRFTVSESEASDPAFAVTSFTLVNADTDEELRTLADGDELVLSTLPTRNLNVYASTSGEVGSVVFALDGQEGYQTESVAPYAMQGDENGDYLAWTPSVGEHTLTATPYVRSSGGGDSGAAHTVHFTVLENNDSALKAGLGATYFADKTLTDSVTTRSVSALDFDAGDGAPVEELPADGFSVRWTGQIEAARSGETTFYTNSDDGVRLWIDGQPVIDAWTNGGWPIEEGTIELEAGRRYDLRVEYYENRGDASMELLWSTPEGRAKVPSSQFYHRPGASASITQAHYRADVAGVDVPRDFALQGNSPNPFRNHTIIHYELAKATEVTLEVYDALGRKVRSLATGQYQTSGYYRARFEAQNLASGVYVVRLTAGKHTRTCKIVLMR